MHDLDYYSDLIEREMNEIELNLQQRKQANKRLLHILEELINKDEDGQLRFGQIIESFFFREPDKMFYEEPVDTLKKVTEVLKQLAEKSLSNTKEE